jgi:hypothetical protein
MSLRRVSQRSIFLLVFLFSIAAGKVQAQYPTDSVQIYLLTASWGDDPSSAFGHSAIRVSDPTRQYNVVYGYGTYDFNTPNFYLKFTLGKLMYSLDKESYDRFYATYQMYGQALYEQKFNLTNKEKFNLVSNLQVNYLPENRYYRYDFFHDNCATRIRDIIEKSVEGKLVYDSLYAKKQLTFRQLIRPNYANVPWLNFGIDLVFGNITDQKATVTGYMFLPEHMMNIYDKTTIASGDSIRPLTKPHHELYPARLAFPIPSLLTSPLTIFNLIFIFFLGFSFLGIRIKRYNRWIDFSFFFVFGILGSLLLFLMTASSHEELWYNSNIVWASPICLLIAIAALLRTNALWFKYVLLFYLLCLTVFIPVSFIIVQEIPAAVYPIIGILWLRSLILLKTRFDTENK